MLHVVTLDRRISVVVLLELVPALVVVSIVILVASAELADVLFHTVVPATITACTSSARTTNATLAILAGDMRK